MKHMLKQRQYRIVVIYETPSRIYLTKKKTLCQELRTEKKENISYQRILIHTVKKSNPTFPFIQFVKQYLSINLSLKNVPEPSILRHGIFKDKVCAFCIYLSMAQVA